MTAESKPRIKITYATLRADNEELHSRVRGGRRRARPELGRHYKNFIDGEWRDGDGTFEARSPIDRNILRRDVRDRHHGRCRRGGGRGAGRPAGLGRDALAGAPRDPAPRRRATSATT